MNLLWHEEHVSDWEDVRTLHLRHSEWGVHHFWFEPWYERGATVRVKRTATEMSAATYNSRPDEILFGDDWPLVQEFFTATSRLAALGSRQHLLKITHCHLNAHGLDVEDELVFALKLAWNRLRVMMLNRRERSRLLRKWMLS